jgi:hypothetical protein
MKRLLSSLLRFFRGSSPPNQPLISPEQMREVFRQMLCDQEIRLSLKSIMGEAEPACVSASDPPASEVAGGDADGRFGTVAGGPRNYTFSADAATRVPLTVQGFAGQSAPLQNWKNSAGDVLATVQASGRIGIGVTSSDAPLDIRSPDGLALQLAGTIATARTQMGYCATNAWWSTGVGNDSESEYGVANKFFVYSDTLDAMTLVIDTAGNVGIGTTEPAEKLDVAGNIKCDGLNKIVFLAPRTDDGDDGTAINDAIANKLPDTGGIIMLTPGTYNIHTTIWITKSGVKLRGYGGNRPSIEPWTGDTKRTLLQWIVDQDTLEDQTIVRLGATDGSYIQDLEISDLAIDGASGVYVQPDARQAEVGLELVSVMNSVFRNVHVLNMRKSTNPAIRPGKGIRLTTYHATVQNPTPPPETLDVWPNCDFNYFLNCSAWGCAKGVLLTNEWGKPAEDPYPNRNPSHNVFLGLDINYWGDSPGDTGLHLQVCDGNVFYRVWMQRQQGSNGQGWGVLIEHPGPTASNYFHQLIPSIGKSGGEGGSFLVRVAAPPDPPLDEHYHKNFVFGYATGDLAEAPLAESNGTRVDPSKYLYWLDEESRSHGVAKLATVGRPAFTPLRSPFPPRLPYKVDVSSETPTLVQQTPQPPPPDPQDPLYEARFLALVEVGDRITITTSAGEETRTVEKVTDNTELVVETPFNGSASGAAMNLFPSLLRVADSSDAEKLLVSDLGDIRASGSADFGSLKIGGTDVITDERVLQNVLMSQNYPESIPRPLVDILGDFPSVRNWGATGDGVTDDRAAFQKAIDNCAGNLLVPPGTYMLSDYLELPSNITIIGIGQPCLKLMPNRPFRTQLEPPTDPTFNAVLTNTNHTSGNHHVRLVGLKLDGNLGDPANPNQIVEQGGVAANLVVVLFNQVSFFEIVDCELTGGVSECFYALGGSIDPYFGTTHGIVSNCFIHDSGQPDVDSLGVHGDRVDGMVVSGCTLQNIGLRAIGFSKGTNVSVCGCTVTNAQGAVELGGTLHASISGVSGKDIRNDGITIALAPDSTAPLNISVAACSFQAKAGNAGYGVRVAGGNFVSVGNVAVRGFAHDGFRVESGYNSLSNVVASNCAEYGIRLTGGDATGCTVGSYRAYWCTLGSESEDGGAAGNEWHSPRMIAEALALNINGEPCIGSSRDIDAHSMKLGTLTAGKPVFAGSDLVLASQDLDLLAAYIVNQLPIARGGTGADNAAGARWMLEVYGKSEVYTKAEVDALLANYVSLATYNAHGHWFGVPGHAHGGVTVGSGTSGEAGAYGNKTGGPY